jgi:hypothetical protein
VSQSEELWWWNDDGGECSCVREASCSRQCCSILPADTTSSSFDTAFSTTTSDLYTQRRMSGVQGDGRRNRVRTKNREAYLVLWVCDSVLWSRDCRGWTRLVVSSTLRQCICLAKTYRKLNSAIQNSITAAFNFSLGQLNRGELFHSSTTVEWFEMVGLLMFPSKCYGKEKAIPGIRIIIMCNVYLALQILWILWTACFVRQKMFLY